MLFKKFYVIINSFEIIKLLIFFTICVSICTLLASVALLIALSFTKNKEKLSQYECGFDPLDNDSRKPTEIHFYIVGILFLIFDIEIALLFPYIFGLIVETSWIFEISIFLFLFLIIIGVIYEWNYIATPWKNILIIILFVFLVKFIILLLIVAYFTLSERKLMATSQRRRGPNVIGFWGVLQPLADGLKLLVKEAFAPFKANFFFFILAPLLILILAIVAWAVIPFGLI